MRGAARRAASGGKPLVLVLSASRVSRGGCCSSVTRRGELESVEVEAEIALARCPRCGTKARGAALRDMLPRKRYGLGVIAERVGTYATWKESLRAVVWSAR